MDMCCLDGDATTPIGSSIIVTEYFRGERDI